MPESEAHALVSAARDLMRVEDAPTAGLWPRAAALLGRQALEAAMRSLWAVTAPGLERTTMRCQLLCVGELLQDRELGGGTHAAWAVLSHGCHHSVYELPPAAPELSGALETVWALAEAAAALRGRVQR